MRVREVTVVKNIVTGKEVVLPIQELDADQFNWNIRLRFHQDCLAYESVVKVEEPSEEEEE